MPRQVSSRVSDGFCQAFLVPTSGCQGKVRATNSFQSWPLLRGSPRGWVCILELGSGVGEGVGEG